MTAAALNVSFGELMNEIMSGRQYIAQTIFNERVWKQRLQTIAAKISDTLNLFKSLNATEKRTFIDDHYGELYKVYDTMLGPFVKMYIPTEIPKHRTVMDRFFNTIGIQRPATYFRSRRIQ